MIWDDLADAWNIIGHNINDVFYIIQYVFSNLGTVFVIIFRPLTFTFNFFKGFFDGINMAPPETAIAWVFPDNIISVFNAVPYWSLFVSAIAGALAVLVLVFVVSQSMKL